MAAIGSNLVKNTGSLVFLSLWVPNKNNPEGFRKIMTGFFFLDALASHVLGYVSD